MNTKTTKHRKRQFSMARELGFLTFSLGGTTARVSSILGCLFLQMISKRKTINSPELCLKWQKLKNWQHNTHEGNDNKNKGRHPNRVIVHICSTSVLLTDVVTVKVEGSNVWENFKVLFRFLVYLNVCCISVEWGIQTIEFFSFEVIVVVGGEKFKHRLWNYKRNNKTRKSNWKSRIL